MNNAQTRPFGLLILMMCLLFLGVSAVIGGFQLVADPSGGLMQMPVSWLAHSPFQNFLIPGLILGVVIGLGSLSTLVVLWLRPNWTFAASLTALTHEHWSWMAAFALGLALVIWIVTQMLMLRVTNGLQWFFLAFGAFMLLLTLEPHVRAYFAEQPERAHARSRS